jgi:transcription elongation GreA/GreB family factor
MAIRKEYRKNNAVNNELEDIIYMTEEEYFELKIQIENKRKELDSASKSIWEATDQSSETWHDNAPFDAAVEHTNLINLQLKELLNKINRSKVIKKQNSIDKVVFWSQVKLLINLKLEKIFTVSWTTNLSKWTLAINTPLWEAIIGKSVWDTWEFKVGKDTTSVKILEILY